MLYTSQLEDMCELAVASEIVTEAEFRDHVKRTMAYVSSEQRYYFPHTMSYIAEKFIWDTLLSSKGQFPGVDPRLSNPISSEHPERFDDGEWDDESEEDEESPKPEITSDTTPIVPQSVEHSGNSREGSQDNALTTIPSNESAPRRVPLQEISPLRRSPETAQHIPGTEGLRVVAPRCYDDRYVPTQDATSSTNLPNIVQNPPAQWGPHVSDPFDDLGDERFEENLYGHFEAPRVLDATPQQQIELLEIVKLDEKRNRRAGKEPDRKQSDIVSIQDKLRQSQNEDSRATGEGPSTNNEECTICSQLFTSRAICRPCGHHFDRHCLQHWEIQNQQFRCPVCRNLVGRYDFVEGGSYASRIPRRLITEDFPCVGAEERRMEWE